MTRRIDRSRHTQGDIHGTFTHRNALATGIIGNGRRRTAGCHSCFSYSRSLGQYDSRHLLTVQHTRTRNLLGIDVDPSSRRYIRQLRHRFIQDGGPYKRRITRTIRSSCGHLLGPSVRARFTARDGRHTSRRTVGMFTRGLHRLLLTSPLKRGHIVNVSPKFHANYGIIYLSTRKGLLRGRGVCPRPPIDGRGRTFTGLRVVVRSCGVSTMTVNGKATDHRARRFLGRRHFGHSVRVFVIDRRKTSVCSTSGVTQSRFPSCSIAMHNTISVNEQLVSPLTRLMGVSPGSVNIKRCRRSISRAGLGGSLSRAMRGYMGLMNIGLGATDDRLLACVSKLNPRLTRGVIGCHTRGNTFASHGRLVGMPHVNTGTFRRYTNFLHVPRTGGPLSGATMRPRDCYVMRRVTGSLNYDMTRLVTGQRLHLGVGPRHCLSPAINVPALGSVLRRLSGPKHSPHKPVGVFRFSGGIHAVDSLHRNVRLPNVMKGVAGFNTFISVNVGRGKLMRLSRLTSEFVSSPGRMISVRRRVHMGMLDVSVSQGHVRLAVGKIRRG